MKSPRRERGASKGAAAARVAGVLALTLQGCADVRETPTVATPDWELDLRPALTAACARCHDGDTPAGDWAVSRYTDAVSCFESLDGGVGVSVANRLRRALGRDDHASYFNPALRRSIDAWITGGARPRRGSMHEGGFVDPRSPYFHGRLLRASRWAQMLDGTRQDACGRCHDGTPSRPSTVREGAPAAGATPCTACHTATAGVLDCSTCHGEGGRVWPGPTCRMLPATHGDAHARHVLPGAALLQPLACATCHPARDTNLATGSHGDGTIDVRFDTAIVGATARYDAASGSCTVSCHSADAMSPTPHWRTPSSGPTCAGCHGAPPAGHWTQPCTTCHFEANATGTALARAALHLNGRVDFGDGTNNCGSCHGSNGDPWPRDATHQAHRNASVTTPVTCDECHEVPATITAAGHLDDRGAGDLRFGARATARGARPSYVSGSCVSVACHGENLIGRSGVRIAWRGGSVAGNCVGCHGAPPALPHSNNGSCELVLCHGSEVERVDGALRIIASQRASHINGVVTAGGAR